jgi:hypothetical protein
MLLLEDRGGRAGAYACAGSPWKQPAGVLRAAGWGAQERRAPGPMVALRPEHWRAFSYVMLNMVSATGIVFANKLVLSVLDFHFVRPVVPGAPAAHSRVCFSARGCAGLPSAAQRVT